MAPHLGTKCPAFYRIQKFITDTVNINNLSLLPFPVQINPIQTFPSKVFRSISILSSHLHLGPLSGLLPSGFLHTIPTDRAQQQSGCAAAAQIWIPAVHLLAWSPDSLSYPDSTTMKASSILQHKPQINNFKKASFINKFPTPFECTWHKTIHHTFTALSAPPSAFSVPLYILHVWQKNWFCERCDVHNVNWPEYQMVKNHNCHTTTTSKTWIKCSKLIIYSIYYTSYIWCTVYCINSLSVYTHLL